MRTPSKMRITCVLVAGLLVSGLMWQALASPVASAPQTASVAVEPSLQPSDSAVASDAVSILAVSNAVGAPIVFNPGGVPLAFSWIRTRNSPFLP